MDLISKIINTVIAIAVFVLGLIHLPGAVDEFDACVQVISIVTTNQVVNLWWCLPLAVTSFVGYGIFAVLHVWFGQSISENR